MSDDTGAVVLGAAADEPVGQRLLSTTKLYYALVDARRFEDLFELFDSEIVYERGGTPTIRGIAQFRDFYLLARVIDHGTHTLDLIAVTPPWTIVRGRFEGVLRSGEEVHIWFSDFMRFGPDRIAERWSYFAGRAV